MTQPLNDYLLADSRLPRHWFPALAAGVLLLPLAFSQPAVAADRSYGAIAYSLKDDAYGWSDGYLSQGDAERIAMEKCSEFGKGCKAAVWFYNSCAAVAAGGTVVTWGQDDTEGGAKEAAGVRCEREGGVNCQIRSSHCSF